MSCLLHEFGCVRQHHRAWSQHLILGALVFCEKDAHHTIVHLNGSYALGTCLGFAGRGCASRGRVRTAGCARPLTVTLGGVGFARAIGVIGASGAPAGGRALLGNTGGH